MLCDPEAAILRELPFGGVVDAILAKRNLGTAITDAPVVLALGPGFTAGVDCHGVVETMRGHDLGRLLTRGAPPPTPASPAMWGLHHPAHHPRPGGRGVRAAGRHRPAGGGGPAGGPGGGPDGLRPAHRRSAGDAPRRAGRHGGHEGGDIDPRCRAEHCFTVSDKARAIGGGVLEGLLYFGRRAGLWSV